MSVYFIYALSLLHGIGIFSSQMVLPLYALKLGASPVAVGFLAATFALFPTLLAVSAGRLIDRFGARWPMTAGSLIGALGQGSGARIGHAHACLVPARCGACAKEEG